jgi:enoyl-CoA hydratase/carnithine racemase
LKSSEAKHDYRTLFSLEKGGSTINRPEAEFSARTDSRRNLSSKKSARQGSAGVILLGSEGICTGIVPANSDRGKRLDFYRFRVTRKVIVQGHHFTTLISAIEGFALGGGLELALVGDIIVAGANAEVGRPDQARHAGRRWHTRRCRG